MGNPTATLHIRHEWPVSGSPLSSALAGSRVGGEASVLTPPHPEAQQLEAPAPRLLAALPRGPLPAQRQLQQCEPRQLQGSSRKMCKRS